MFTYTYESHSTSRHSPAGETSSASRPGDQPDADIQIDAERALRQDPVLRGTADQIDLFVHKGVAYLSGYVATDSHKARAEVDVQQVPGVRQVENHLIADAALEVMVADRLGRDPQLSHHPIFVRSTRGILRLDGEVDSPELAHAAECIAADVAGVRAVLNLLHVAGAAANAPCQVLLPSIGQEVFASDGLLGRVERVILDPDSRRVTAIVVNAHFYSPEDVSDRTVLSPISTVKLVNASGVELAITCRDAAGLLDFDPTKFASPNPDGQAPYGYLPTGILLDPSARSTWARLG